MPAFFNSKKPFLTKNQKKNSLMYHVLGLVVFFVDINRGKKIVKVNIFL